MAGISTILGFDVNGNFPVDQKRLVVEDEAERLAIEWVYEGLITYQKDTNEYYKCLVNVKTNSENPFTDVGDWELLYENGADGVDGTIWYYDNGTPDVGTGVNGDFFFDFDKGNIYVKIAGTWELQLNVIGDRYATTSTSSVLIGTGAKTFTVDTGLAYTAEQSILIVDNAAPSTNNMEATVTSYNPTTGSLVVDVTAINGAGTLADWTINLSGASGSQGNPFEVDADDVTLSDSLVTTIEGTSGATASDPYVITVLNDTRTAATQRVGIEGVMTGRAIAYNGTSWRRYGTWRGPTGPTGFLISGSNNQTARYNGTSGQWEASSALTNDGTTISATQMRVTGAANSLRVGSSTASTSWIPFLTNKSTSSGNPNQSGYFGFASESNNVLGIVNQAEVGHIALRARGNVMISPSTSSTPIEPTNTLDINGSARIRGLATAGIVKNSATGVLSTVAKLDYNNDLDNKPTIASAASGPETNAGLLSDKYVAPSTLAGWWSNVKTLVQTFAAKITFTSAPRFDSVTAGQFLKVDSNKDLTSVSTINYDTEISNKPTLLTVPGTAGNKILLGDGGSGMKRDLAFGFQTAGSNGEKRMEIHCSALGSDTAKVSLKDYRQDSFAMSVNGDSQGKLQVNVASQFGSVPTMLFVSSFNGTGLLTSKPTFTFQHYTTKQFEITHQNNFFLANTTGTPGTPSGGGYLYVEAGELKYKGSSGTITIIAPA